MIRYFDMFAGIGGFRAGLTRAGGFQCVGHCEIDKYAHAGYCAIHDPGKEEVYYPDARKIDPSTMPDFDLLCGGFPCQSFSQAGKRKGFEDARGTLFFEIARLAETRRPPYLLLENVPGLLSHDQGKTFAAILHALYDLGYHVEWMVLNSADFGVPQSRKRVFLICYLDPRCAGKILPVPEAAGKAPVQIIGGPQGSRVYDAEGTAITQTAQAGGKGGKTGLYFVGFNRNDRIVGQRDTALALNASDYRGLDRNQTQNAVFVDLCQGHPTQTELARCITADYGKAQMSTRKGEMSGVLFVKEATKRGYKEAVPSVAVELGPPPKPNEVGSVGRGGARERAQFSPCGGNEDERTLRRRDIAHTLETSCAQGVVERCGRIRRLMPRECLRLQGFAEDQIDRLLAITSDAQAYKQAGNSVTVNVIEAIGRNLRAVDAELKSQNGKAGDTA